MCTPGSRGERPFKLTDKTLILPVWQNVVGAGLEPGPEPLQRPHLHTVSVQRAAVPQRARLRTGTLERCRYRLASNRYPWTPPLPIGFGQLPLNAAATDWLRTGTLERRRYRLASNRYPWTPPLPIGFGQVPLNAAATDWLRTGTLERRCYRLASDRYPWTPPLPIGFGQVPLNAAATDWLRTGTLERRRYRLASDRYPWTPPLPIGFGQVPLNAAATDWRKIIVYFPVKKITRNTFIYLLFACKCITYDTKNLTIRGRG